MSGWWIYKGMFPSGQTLPGQKLAVLCFSLLLVSVLFGGPIVAIKLASGVRYVPVHTKSGRWPSDNLEFERSMTEWESSIDRKRLTFIALGEYVGTALFTLSMVGLGHGLLTKRGTVQGLSGIGFALGLFLLNYAFTIRYERFY